MDISLIAAIAQNRGIGKENKLLWHLPKDLHFFKKTTQNHHVLMGRKTFESIGKALPKRTNIILSHQKIQYPNCFVFDNIQKAFEFAQQNNETELFIIGGEKMYNLVLPYANRIYLTEVEANLEADTFFPNLDKSWKVIKSEYHQADEKNILNFKFVLYEKI